METITVEWGSATFTIKPANIRMAMQRDMILSNIKDAIPDASAIEALYFAQVCAQVTIDGELSWAIPPVGTTGKELIESFDYFCESLPESMLRSLLKALRIVDEPYVAAEFAPYADLEALDPKD